MRRPRLPDVVATGLAVSALEGLVPSQHWGQARPLLGCWGRRAAQVREADGGFLAALLSPYTSQGPGGRGWGGSAEQADAEALRAGAVRGAERRRRVWSDAATRWAPTSRRGVAGAPREACRGRLALPPGVSCHRPAPAWPTRLLLSMARPGSGQACCPPGPSADLGPAGGAQWGPISQPVCVPFGVEMGSKGVYKALNRLWAQGAD